jgi:hypothetical protein
MFAQFTNKQICSKLFRGYPLLTPIIMSVSSYVSNTDITVVNISGDNFRDYSIIHFDQTIISSIFVNSENIFFYVPRTYLSGTYEVQVFNNSYGSNIILFTYSI